MPGCKRGQEKKMYKITLSQCVGDRASFPDAATNRCDLRVLAPLYQVPSVCQASWSAFCKTFGLLSPQNLPPVSVSACFCFINEEMHAQTVKDLPKVLYPGRWRANSGTRHRANDTDIKRWCLKVMPRSYSYTGNVGGPRDYPPK
ncbi:RING finger protein 122 isoform X5 [Physeter macrocephalus]|uniref:RING finger protein 122 isoform X5 n=1 Tax=Physeter macrocephalus TaxID=9755 RepID=A0A9W2WDX9_PHYMC|nr:RING finger protein 122 isoform X5 [Physeter catodon]